MAYLFGVSLQTIYAWCKRNKNFKDKRRRARKSRITQEIEESIYQLRIKCKYGSAAIQQALNAAPTYLVKVLNIKQNIKLSRTTINNILKKKNLNGYPRKIVGFSRHRSSKPNELWQLDLKGPVHRGGTESYYLACIDDYSRYIIKLEKFDKVPTSEEAFNSIKSAILNYKPKAILTDNGSQFKKNWDNNCRKLQVNSIHARPRRPEDKGKVERFIGVVTSEFLSLYYLLKNIDNLIDEYVLWYNTKRFHRGINMIPHQLFHNGGDFKVRNFT